MADQSFSFVCGSVTKRVCTQKPMLVCLSYQTFFPINFVLSLSLAFMGISPVAGSQQELSALFCGGFPPATNIHDLFEIDRCSSYVRDIGRVALATMAANGNAGSGARTNAGDSSMDFFLCEFRECQFSLRY